MMYYEVCQNHCWFEVHWRFPTESGWHLYEYTSLLEDAKKTSVDLMIRNEKYQTIVETRIKMVYRNGDRFILQQEGR